MQESKMLKGKVIEADYKKGVFSLISSDIIFIFTKKDILDDIIKTDDIVSFRGEEINGIKRAFFIKKIGDDKL